MLRDILRCHKIKKLIDDSSRTHHTVSFNAFDGKRGHLLLLKRLINLVLDIINYPHLLPFVGNTFIDRYLGKECLTVGSVRIEGGRFVWEPQVRLTVDVNFVLVVHFIIVYLNLKV